MQSTGRGHLLPPSSACILSAAVVTVVLVGCTGDRSPSAPTSSPAPTSEVPLISETPAIALAGSTGVDVDGRAVAEFEVRRVADQEMVGIHRTDQTQGPVIVWWRGGVCGVTTVSVEPALEGLVVTITPGLPGPLDCPDVEALLGVELTFDALADRRLTARLLDESGAELDEVVSSDG